MSALDLDGVLQRIPVAAGRKYVATPLEGGITNRNFKVTFLDGPTWPSIVVRFAGKDTHLLGIDRYDEREANTRAAELGIGPPVVHFVEPEGYLVTAFIEALPLDTAAIREPRNLTAVAALLRTFHESPPISGVFDSFRIPETYATTAGERGVVVPAAYELAAQRSREIEAAFALAPEPLVPCHNDLLNANFLIDVIGHVWLLDWEYAGVNSRWFDLGNFAVNHDFDADERDALIAAYFGAITPKRQARLALFTIMSDLREAMWGVVQQGISTLDFDYRSYATKHFERLLGNAARPGYRAWLEAAAQPGA
jgi:thiamine kinase-like enzyme